MLASTPEADGITKPTAATRAEATTNAQATKKAPPGMAEPLSWKKSRSGFGVAAAIDPTVSWLLDTGEGICVGFGRRRFFGSGYILRSVFAIGHGVGRDEGRGFAGHEDLVVLEFRRNIAAETDCATAHREDCGEAKHHDRGREDNPVDGDRAGVVCEETFQIHYLVPVTGGMLPDVVTLRVQVVLVWEKNGSRLGIFGAGRLHEAIRYSRISRSRGLPCAALAGAASPLAGVPRCPRISPLSAFYRTG